MGKKGEQQRLLNTQFNDDLAEVKTKQLFLTQALGATVLMLDELLERLVQRRALAEDDALIVDFQKAIAQVRKFGMRLEPPVDPDAPVYQVKCPGCQAVIKAPPGGTIERCDWCGHVFTG